MNTSAPLTQQDLEYAMFRCACVSANRLWNGRIPLTRWAQQEWIAFYALHLRNKFIERTGQEPSKELLRDGLLRVVESFPTFHETHTIFYTEEHREKPDEEDLSEKKLRRIYQFAVWV